MRTTTMMKTLVTVIVFVLTTLAEVKAQQVYTESSSADTQVEVNILFASAQVRSVAELRTNALVLLKAKGHVVPESATCVVNISLDGKDRRCAVLFWDLGSKMGYQVLFDNHGQAQEVSGGPIRHGRVLSTDKPPKVPEN
ncbi:MAG TPA: hypothetical protein VEC99_08490 [Clostridia bacterium]|nr:hypothetical protein [Clostridia bacterium]